MVAAAVIIHSGWILLNPLWQICNGLIHLGYMGSLVNCLHCEDLDTLLSPLELCDSSQAF